MLKKMAYDMEQFQNFDYRSLLFNQNVDKDVKKRIFLFLFQI